MPRVCEELLAAAEARRATAGIDAVLSVAYVEVFGSEVTDLLLTMTPYYLLLTMALATIYLYTPIPTDLHTSLPPQVTDLLREGAPIGSGGEGQADNFFHAHRWVLEGRADVPIDSAAAAASLIARGDACKRRAATAMNERSSRAHSLFILSLVQVTTYPYP